MPQSSLKRSKALDQAIEANFQKVMAALHPQKFQANEDAYYSSLLDKYDKDPSKFNQKKQPQQGGQTIRPGQSGFTPMGTNQPDATIEAEPSLRELVSA